jgi:DhnA family fructose-bisphosphate aldolase class Ia
MVISFLLGYQEEIEAACLKTTVTLAIEGRPAGMPLVVEVRPTGRRVSIPSKAVELGASYALEGGADVIAIPYPGTSSLKTISQFVCVPWLVKPTSFSNAQQELQEALDLGCSGLWLDHTLFAQANPAQVLQALRAQLHPVPSIA